MIKQPRALGDSFALLISIFLREQSFGLCFKKVLNVKFKIICVKSGKTFTARH